MAKKNPSKLLACTLALVLFLSFFLTSCASSNEDRERDNNLIQAAVPEYDGVRFVITDVTSRGAAIRMESEYDYFILMGWDYELFIMNYNGTFIKVKSNEKSSVPAILTEPGAVPYLQEQYLDFRLSFGHLLPGHYRFVVSLEIYEDMITYFEEKSAISDFEEVVLYTDFQVGLF